MKRFGKFLNLVIIFVCLFMFVSCSDEPEYVTYRFPYYSYLDTMSTVTVQWDENQCSIEDMKKKMEKIDDILLNVEKIFSPERTIIMQMKGVVESELMKFNNNCGLDSNGAVKFVSVSQEFINVLKNAESVSKLLNGSFDVSVGPLTSLWNISNQVGVPSEFVNIPSQDEITNTLSKIDFNNIVIDEENLKVGSKINGMKLDFGAIAKGYACDRVFDYLKSLNLIKIGLIDLGGNIYSFGSNEGVETSMAIRNPFYTSTNGEDYVLLSTPLNDVSMVTSGIYERYIEKDGVTYHHLLDPKTGYPFDNNIESVTIIGTSSMTCDALATGIYGLGLDNGIEKIKFLPDYMAIFVTKDRKVYIVGDIQYTPSENIKNFEFIKVE